MKQSVGKPGRYGGQQTRRDKKILRERETRGPKHEKASVEQNARGSRAFVYHTSRSSFFIVLTSQILPDLGKGRLRTGRRDKHSYKLVSGRFHGVTNITYGGENFTQRISSTVVSEMSRQIQSHTMGPVNIAQTLAAAATFPLLNGSAANASLAKYFCLIDVAGTVSLFLIEKCSLSLLTGA